MHLKNNKYLFISSFIIMPINNMEMFKLLHKSPEHLYGATEPCLFNSQIERGLYTCRKGKSIGRVTLDV